MEGRLGLVVTMTAAYHSEFESKIQLFVSLLTDYYYFQKKMYIMIFNIMHLVLYEYVVICVLNVIKFK